MFAVRITDDERARLEEEKKKGGGPRALGPWIVWRALHPPEIRRAARRDASRRGDLGDTSSTWSGSTELPPAAVVPGYARRTRRARVVPDAPPLVLDLCAGSGSWSRPYELAGYRVLRVSLPEHDVRTFVLPEGERVHGVLAAPPCDQFSLARNGTPSPRDLVRGMECVNACMRIVAQARPAWWALENPVGLLSHYLGTPRDTFEPCDFGDPWTKRTALWGSFTLPERGPFVEPLGGGPLCTLCDPERRRTTWCSRADHRAITPAGFARAFFRANP